MYERKRIEGPPVVKKLTATVEYYKKILSNPQALDLINNRLRKHGILEKAYDLVSNNAFYAFEKGDEKWYDFLQIFKMLFPNVDPKEIPESRLFREAFNSADKKVLEKLRKEFVQYLLQNPISIVFFSFILVYQEMKEEKIRN